MDGYRARGATLLTEVHSGRRTGTGEQEVPTQSVGKNTFYHENDQKLEQVAQRLWNIYILFKAQLGKTGKPVELTLFRSSA